MSIQITGIFKVRWFCFPGGTASDIIL